ncbi:MAG: SAM-dependent methyltransferase [Isosphaeraceae bacterium]
MTGHNLTPNGIDTKTPNVARLYGYLLGGKDKFAADREAAKRPIEAIPDVAAIARDNRSFLGRVVRYLATEGGIRQFLDLGSGLPAQADAHELAEGVATGVHVVYGLTWIAEWRPPLIDRPRTGQRVVDGGDDVVQDVRVRLVEEEPLLHDSLVVLVERCAARIESARSIQQAGLHLQRVVAPVAVLVDPFADRIAHVGRLESLRKIAAVGVDPAQHVQIFDHDVDDLGLDHDLHGEDHVHRPRHAVGNADAGGVVALAAGRLVGEARLENRLVFRRQRRLLAATERLRDVPLVDDGNGSVHPRLLPLAGEIGVFRFVERLRGRTRHGERRCKRESTQPISSVQDVSLLVVTM